MNELLSLTRLAWNERLGWTILHSLWQIAAITAVFAASSFLLRRSSPRARYALGCLSLLAMVGLPLATFIVQGNAQPRANLVAAAHVDPLPTDRAAEALAQVSAAPNDDAQDSPVERPVQWAEPVLMAPFFSAPAWTASLGRFLPWISGGWMLGVVLFSLRPLLGLLTVRRLRSQGLSPPPARLTRLAEDLVARFGIHRPVQFAQSALVQVPTVLGYLRPIVLLPASAITGLSPDQLELILAHELAHIRRHDYLVNVLQTGVETIFFYHPGTWWVSARVRAERENCCDDAAVALCGSRGAYVGALLALEQQRAPSPLALAATGGSLVVRARRLISPAASETGLHRASAWLAGLLPMGTVALLLLLGSTFAARSGGAENESQAQPPAVAQASPDAATEADGKPAPAKPTTNAGDSKAKEGDAAPATDADPLKIAFHVTIEDGASAKLKIDLMGSYRDPIKTWENVEPGDVRLDLPKVEDDRYRLEVSAPGYAQRRMQLNISREGIDLRPERLDLYRRRYAVLRYAVNMAGERDLVGPNVKEGRVAISSFSVPDLHGDWRIMQDDDVPTFHRSNIGPLGVENGFAFPPADTAFDDLKLAPKRGQYTGEPRVAAEKGMILFNRIVGHDFSGRRYAKILVEDVTETPPTGVQVIDTPLAPTRSTIKVADEPDDDGDGKSNGEVTVTIALEDNAQAPVKLTLNTRTGKPSLVWNSDKPGVIKARLPKLKDGWYYGLVASAEGYCPASTQLIASEDGVNVTEASVTLRRVRYAVLHYAINTKGERNLTGENVKEGRLSILSGKVPQLTDWEVEQRDGQVVARAIRVGEDVGFVMPREGAKFDELDKAPSNEEYTIPRSEDGIRTEFPLKKGLIFFNRVKGSRAGDARYAKIEVEEITETPPADFHVIDSRLPASRSAGKTGNPASRDVSVSIVLEDNARAPVKVEIRDRSRKLVKAWDSEKPGMVRAQIPELKDGPYDITASAEGYGPVTTLLNVSDAGVAPANVNVDLYRVRYVVLRYAINTKGERNLTGENVKEGRVAVVFGAIPLLEGWRVEQSEGKAQAFLLRHAGNSGFVRAQRGAKFDELDEAPPSEQYRPDKLPLEKDMILFNHLAGGRPEDERYAKIEVEEITETPPADVKVVGAPRPAIGSARETGNATSSDVSVSIGLEDKARAPVKLELRDSSRKLLKAWDSEKPGVVRAQLPELKQGLYDITASAEGYAPVRTFLRVSDAGVVPADVNVDLYRVRYIVLRYAVNTKGERNLTGENVTEERVAVMFGVMPQLRGWRVEQSDGKTHAFVLQRDGKTGFVQAPGGAKFDELDQAPPIGQYRPDRFSFEKGMIVFNYVAGGRPEDERYAKLLVEEISETRPENIEIIDSYRK